MLLLCGGWEFLRVEEEEPSDHYYSLTVVLPYQFTPPGTRFPAGWRWETIDGRDSLDTELDTEAS